MNQAAIFLHIPKTAGTTLYHIAERHYKPTEYFILNNTPKEVGSFRATSATRLSELRFIGGHIPFGMHDWLPQPATYITFLRQPVSLVNSYYHYVRTTSDHPLHHTAQTNDLLQFLHIDHNMRNPQTRMLAGISAEECQESDLALARRNLETAFAVVGLTEQFDATLLLIKDALQWTNVNYARMNVNRKKQSLAPDEIAEIEDANALDIQLYQFATKLFAQQIEQKGSEFTSRLSQFQRDNQRNYWWQYGKAQWQRQRRIFVADTRLHLQRLRLRIHNRIKNV